MALKADAALHRLCQVPYHPSPYRGLTRAFGLTLACLYLRCTTNAVPCRSCALVVGTRGLMEHAMSLMRCLAGMAGPFLSEVADGC